MTAFLTKTCFKCKFSKHVSNFNMNVRKKDKLDPVCKECRSIKRKEMRKATYEYEVRNKDKIKERRMSRPDYNMKMNEYSCTVVGRSNRMFNGAKRRAFEKNIEFTITLEEVKLKLQTGKCERTGINFELVSATSLFSPSIDRIDSSKGYTSENIQIVCCAYNTGKGKMHDEQFENFILMAADFIRGKRK